MYEVEAPVELPIPLPSPAPDTPEEALSWLGGTVEEIAEGLRARGIKGLPENEYSCPLAAYLGIWWDNPCVAYPIRVDGHPHFVPQSFIHDFICGFDVGDFPDLIAD